MTRTRLATRPKGPRPKGAPSARDALLDAALSLFADQGYHRTGIRDVARAAGVDSALVYHYFGSKRGLFDAAVRSRMMPSDLSPARLRAETEAQMAERLVRMFFTRWGADGGAKPLVALLRSATSDPEIATGLREVFEQVLIPHVEARLGAEHARVRVGLAAAHLLGLGFVRYVVRLPPLATCSLDELARQGARGIVAALHAGGGPA